eukprot:SAG31_NODE_3009_length_4790_cov_2.862503_4_plen_64_part_00
MLIPFPHRYDEGELMERQHRLPEAAAIYSTAVAASEPPHVLLACRQTLPPRHFEAAIDWLSRA